MKNQNKYQNNDYRIQLEQMNVQIGMLPPQAIDVEESIIGAMMLERDCFINFPVKKEWFYKEDHQKIIECIRELVEKSIPVDLMQVTKKLKDKNYLDEVGGPGFITKLTRKVASAAHIEHHIRIIKQEFARRELIRVSSEITRKSYDQTLDVFDLFSFTQTEISKIMSFDTEDSSSTYEEATNNVIKGLETEIEPGIKTGFSKFDNFTGGLHSPDLIIIAGETSQGKTSLVVSIVRHVSKKGLPVAMYSTEMTKEQLVVRMTAQETGVNSKLIMYNKLDRDVKSYVISELFNNKNLPIYFDDNSNNDIDKICTSIRKLKIKYNIGLAVVDFIQDLKGADTESGLAEIGRKLKNIAKELEIPIIALSQLSRDKAKPKPTMSRLRGSGQLEEKADIIMLVWRPEYYGMSYSEPHDSVETNGTAQIIIGKGRNVGIGSFILNFNKDTTKFFDHIPIDKMIESEIETNGNKIKDQPF